MPRRSSLACWLALPLAVALLAACGGGSEDPAGPPQVACGSQANVGPLVVNAAPTCGSIVYPGYNRYTFTASTTGRYAVTLWTTSGDVDLFVGVLGTSYDSMNSPPQWVDGVTFDVGLAGAVPEVVVNAYSTSSTYAVQVTGP